MSSSSIARSSCPSKSSRSVETCCGPTSLERGWYASRNTATTAAAASAPLGTSDQLQLSPERAPCACSSARSRASTSRARVAASTPRALASNACFALRSKSVVPPTSVDRSFVFFIPVLLAVLSDQLAQSVHGARVMSLHTSFCAIHRNRRLRDVETLEVAQRESLALSRRQHQQRLLERAHRVLREHLVERVVRFGARRHCDRVVLLVALDAAEKAQHARAHGTAALHVADPILEDAVEQRPPLLARAPRVTAHEPDHAVLHDVE